MPPPLILSERERSKDRDRLPTASGAGSGSGAMSFLPNIFGRRPAPPATTRTTASKSQPTDSQRGRDERASPRSAQLTLSPTDSSDTTRRGPSPAPFHLDSALGLMQSGTQSLAELTEVVKATAVWLANRLLGEGDVFEDGHRDQTSELSDDNIHLLYSKATEFAQPKSDYNLRIAAIRLFAALLATSHPSHSDHRAAGGGRQLREIYRLITMPSSPLSKPSSAAKVDAVFVEIGALRALTENGTDIQGLDGILGWCVQTLADIRDDWMAWCGKRDETGVDWAADATKTKSQPFGPIKPASPAEAISAIIDLLHAIVASQLHIIGPTDLTKMVLPLFNALVVGMNAAPSTAEDFGIASPPLRQRRGSPAASALGSPSIYPSTALGLEGPLRQSSAAQRPTRRDTQASSALSTPLAKTTLRMTTGSPQVNSPASYTSPHMRPPSPRLESSRIRWAEIVPSLFTFLGGLIETAQVSEELFEQVVVLACLWRGQDDRAVLSVGAAAYDEMLGAILGKRGKKGEQCLRGILEGRRIGEKEKKTAFSDVKESQRKIAAGAVLACSDLLEHPESAKPDSDRAFGLPSLSPSIRMAASSVRFPSDTQIVQRQQWRPVDYAILTLVQRYLLAIADAEAGEAGGLDAYTVGEAVCELLDAVAPAVALALAPPQQQPGETRSASVDSVAQDVMSLPALFSVITTDLPNAIGHLHASTSSSPTFYHPKYIALLLDLAKYLDEKEADIVLNFYQTEALCLPFTNNWIRNIWRLIDAFYLQTSHLPEARAKFAKILFEDVYQDADEVTEHRKELVDKVLVPFLDKSLFEEPDEDFTKAAMDVLVDAAVSDLKECGVGPGQSSASNKDLTGTFYSIRSLLVKVATQTMCRNESHPAAAGSNPFAALANHASGIIDSISGEPRRSSAAKSREPSGASALRGLVTAFSPTMKAQPDMPVLSTISSISPPPPRDHVALPPEEQIPPLPHSDLHPQQNQSHDDCQSLQAICALIAIFTRLTFDLEDDFEDKTPQGLQTSEQAIVIYRDILGLLYPMTDDHPGAAARVPAPTKVAARCPRARVIALSWLMRLRADAKHRIYLRVHLDTAVSPYAATLKRTRDTEPHPPSHPRESSDLQRKVSQAAHREGNSDERGRRQRSPNPAPVHKSRSRSRQAPMMRGPDATYSPYWRIPDTLPFEAPPDLQSAEDLLTYDPNHPALREEGALPIEGVWLPVSEYVRVLNGILRGHDWELVSYVLTFLPLQMANKLFFHGQRAVREVRALLDVLCSGVLGSGTAWDKRINTPTFIKKSDVNSAAYQCLSTLTAYRGVFGPTECDKLVQAFLAGIGTQGAGVTKVCLQALTVGIFELDKQIGRYLLEILEAMTKALTSPGVAVHILEFLISLGQTGSLFRNFRENDFRLVFAVATGYIGEHNDRAKDIDISSPDNKEAFVLSQHVIGLAYYSIYIWFVQLKLHQRPAIVSEITRKLLESRAKTSKLDEMAEVCFDWLARYTYGNADPKPASSFLSDVVMSDDPQEGEAKAQSWLLGGAIVTVTMHRRTGWATISTTRPTGSTAVVCKLENVPIIDLGEAGADLVSLPAVLMANRGDATSMTADAGTGEGGEHTTAGSINDAKTLAQVRSTTSPTAKFDNSSLHGYVWSGATPSQRRKDVIVEPSYLALQLLSSYPNASLETPRGRLIPPEEVHLRTLRMINNTPVIDTLKIAVLYVAPKQSSEVDILGNIDGSPLYLDFLSGLGRLIKLKGQKDVFVGGLNREDDSDGEYAYAWWDDLTQVIFHTPTMMPNRPQLVNHEAKKRLVGNDYIKIVYNDSGGDFAFDTIKTEWNMINVVISPHSTGAGIDDLPRLADGTIDPNFGAENRTEEAWLDWDREDWFKVTLQRRPGIPDFSPIGNQRLVSRHALPVFVRQVAQLANDMAARYVHIRDAQTAEQAEYITSWRSRLRAMQRLRDKLPPIELPPEADAVEREKLLRDFTRSFTYRPPAGEKD